MTPDNLNSKILDEAFAEIRAAGNEAQWRKACEWLDRPEVARAPDFIFGEIKAALEIKRRELISVARPS